MQLHFSKKNYMPWVVLRNFVSWRHNFKKRYRTVRQYKRVKCKPGKVHFWSNQVQVKIDCLKLWSPLNNNFWQCVCAIQWITIPIFVNILWMTWNITVHSSSMIYIRGIFLKLCDQHLFLLVDIVFDQFQCPYNCT